MKDLRHKTMEVEEISMKIDEIQNKNNELEIIIKKIDSFDRNAYENGKGKS